MAAVQQNGDARGHASEVLKGDKGVVMAAVLQDGHAFEHVSEVLKGDKDIAMAYFQQNRNAFGRSVRSFQVSPGRLFG